MACRYGKADDLLTQLVLVEFELFVDWNGLVRGELHPDVFKRVLRRNGLGRAFVPAYVRFCLAGLATRDHSISPTPIVDHFPDRPLARKVEEARDQTAGTRLRRLRLQQSLQDQLARVVLGVIPILLKLLR